MTNGIILKDGGIHKKIKKIKSLLDGSDLVDLLVNKLTNLLTQIPRSFGHVYEVN